MPITSFITILPLDFVVGRHTHTIAHRNSIRGRETNPLIFFLSFLLLFLSALLVLPSVFLCFSFSLLNTKFP